MKVDWTIIPGSLTTVTAEVVDAGHGLTLNHPMAWDGTEHLQPKIWISGTGELSWDDESEHLLFAYLPDYAVEFEVGDTTETCIQFRPQSTEQPSQPEQEPVTIMNKLALEIASDAISYRELVWNLSKKVFAVATSAELVKGQANRVQVTAEAMSDLRRFVEKGVIERLAFNDKRFDTHHAAAWKLYAAPQPTPFYATPPQRTEEKNT